MRHWVRNSVVAAASKKGIPSINLMCMRWVLTRKSEGRFKLRIVVEGFTDLHLAHLRRESPTASRWARNFFFGRAASAHMHVHKGDVTAAFLQGSDTELERGVLDEPVQELAETLKFQPLEYVRLRKAVYGLVNAPRAWWVKINEVMGHLGWFAASLEPCLWMLMSEDGRISGLCCPHVYDFMVALEERESETQQHFETLKQQFLWGSWEDADFILCGVHFCEDLMHDRWGEIRLDQHDHALAIESLQCSSSARDEQVLTSWEVAGLWGLSGSLQWLTTQTMPWIQAELSFLQGGKHTVGTVRKFNTLLRQAQQSGSRLLVFHCHRAPCVVTYSDAAWAVRRKGESRAGVSGQAKKALCH